MHVVLDYHLQTELSVVHDRRDKQRQQGRIHGMADPGERRRVVDAGERDDGDHEPDDERNEGDGGQAFRPPMLGPEPGGTEPARAAQRATLPHQLKLPRAA